jgi:hypothetical protein
MLYSVYMCTIWLPTRTVGSGDCACTEPHFFGVSVLGLVRSICVCFSWMILFFLLIRSVK